MRRGAPADYRTGSRSLPEARNPKHEIRNNGAETKKKKFGKRWPFARGGYTQLMKSSLGAVEAAHVPAPPRPVFGRGLPAQSGVYRNVWHEGSGFGVALGAGSDTALYSTTDRGVTWSDASKGLPADRRPNIEAMSIAAYKDGFTLFAGDTDGIVYASEDGAETWTRIAGGLAPVTKGNHYRPLQLAS